MDKKDLISQMAEEAGITQAQATSALQAYEHAVTMALAYDDNVVIEGFGTFSATERSARKGRDPRSGQNINIAAKKVVKFKASKAMDKTIN